MKNKSTQHKPSSSQKEMITNVIRASLADVSRIYLFGSRISGALHDASDYDIAVMQSSKLNFESVLKIKMELSAELRSDVDLIDLFSADTVTKFQVVSTGEVIWQKDAKETAFFETLVFSQYANLNEERSEIIEDIENRGSIFGR